MGMRILIKLTLLRTILSPKAGEPEFVKWWASDLQDLWYEARWSSGIALRSTRPQVRGSNPGLGKVYSTFHPFIGSIK